MYTPTEQCPGCGSPSLLKSHKFWRVYACGTAWEPKMDEKDVTIACLRSALKDVKKGITDAQQIIEKLIREFATLTPVPTEHKPQHQYDCPNCKYNWICGPDKIPMPCVLAQSSPNLPPLPDEKKTEVAATYKAAGHTAPYTDQGRPTP